MASDTTPSRAPTAPAHPETGDQASAKRRHRRISLLAGALVLAALGAAAYGYYWLHRPKLPPGFASGNGRVEATEYDIATKRAGRIVEVRVREGDIMLAAPTYALVAIGTVAFAGALARFRRSVSLA
jgi:HlyD family secretion protein